VLLGLVTPYGVSFDGAFCEKLALSLIARDNSEPGRPDAEAWVLHASAAWSAEHLEDQPVHVVSLLERALVQATGVELPEVVHSDVHRWRFARPDSGLDVGTLADEGRGLALAGDAYTGGRVEGAYLSGVAAAERIFHRPA
jgi:predicted NAD/FAD-dependent oxidoreductase